MPELTEQVQAALDAAGIPGATVRVYAFGEDCIDSSGEVRYFATMETDIDVRLEVADLRDLDALGELTERVLAVLEAFPQDSLPGPQPGRIGLLFSKGEAVEPFYFMVEQLEASRASGLHGRALLEYLGYSP